MIVNQPFPLFASATPLLFHSVNNSMDFRIAVVFSDNLVISPVVFVYTIALAFFAPTPQAIFAAGMFAELTFVF